MTLSLHYLNIDLKQKDIQKTKLKQNFLAALHSLNDYNRKLVTTIPTLTRHSLSELASKTAVENRGGKGALR